MEKVDILIIEDNVHMIEFIEEVAKFGLLKANITLAKTGEEGLNLLQTKKFDGVILDVILPKINGEDILHRIKNQDITKVVFTGMEKCSEYKNINWENVSKQADLYLKKGGHKDNFSVAINYIIKMNS